MGMSKSQRERRHQANLEKINRVQALCGTGDATRVDHEATLIERARLMAQELRSHCATEAGLAAFDRLLRAAEEPAAAHRGDVLDFLAAVWSKRPLPLAVLRGPDAAIADDMLAVLDAYRYGRLNLVEQVAGGPARVARLLSPLAQQ
jgi:hypothetical protein